MDQPHDPLQIVKQLRQALAAPKLSVGIFLGAGCPCSIKKPGAENQPLIPDVAGLTKQVCSKLQASSDQKDNFAKLLAVMKNDGNNDPNIELILGRIRALHEVAGNGDARGLSAQALSDLDRHVCTEITEVVKPELPASDNAYRALARFVESRALPATEIFTTNYDLLIEHALEAQRVPYFDGFVGSVRPFFDQRAIEDDVMPRRWCRVWKLHGSINWRANKEIKAICRSRDTADGAEQLIHPSHRKYDESRRMPYFVMIDRLRTFIRNQNQPVALFVIGYSFGDQHLNEVLIESLKANPSAACFALQFDVVARYPEAKNLACDTGTFSLLTRDGAVIRRRWGSWEARAAADVTSIASVFDLDGEAEPDKPKPCRFVLGDFARFGPFLNEFLSSTLE